MNWVKITEGKLRALALLTFIHICFVMPSCILIDEYPNCPSAFEGDDARSKLESLREFLWVSGVMFFNEKIYLSTGGAILEFTGERLDKVYKCRRSDGDESLEVGIDRISSSVWFFKYRDFALLRFDGDKWSTQEPPKLPEPESYSREDINAGFKAFNYNGQFVLLNKNRFNGPNTGAWTQSDGKIWKSFPMPSMNCDFGNTERSIEKGCLVEIGPIGDELCSVLHGNRTGRSIAKGESVLPEFTPQTDIVACKRGNSWRVLNPQGTEGFFSDKVAAGNSTMYAATRTGKIFHITNSGPEPMPTLGHVEALTIGSEGNLIVWFSGQGIYEFKGEWKKLFDAPVDTDSKRRGNLIRENAGTIVVTAREWPTADSTTTTPDLVWIMKDGRVVRIL